MSAANAKRLALTRDQRAVLEAVYAIEKLPDATLRERLSKYLDLSARQIQVWFQNRRQRAKASGTSPASPAKKSLATPGQIMDALFEFPGNLATEDPACVAAMSQAALQGGVGGLTAALGVAAGARGGGTSSDSGSSESPPASSLDYESFEWGLGAGQASHSHPPMQSQVPPKPAMKGTHAGTRGSNSQIQQPVAMRAANLNGPANSAANLAATWSPSDILDAVLGFASHQLQLQAAELWPLPTAAGPAAEPLYSHFATGDVGADLTQCRRLLAPRLCESAAMTHEIAWYGVTTEQKEAFGKRLAFLPWSCRSPSHLAVVGPSMRLRVHLISCADAYVRSERTSHLIADAGFSHLCCRVLQLPTTFRCGTWSESRASNRRREPPP